MGVDGKIRGRKRGVGDLDKGGPATRQCALGPGLSETFAPNQPWKLTDSRDLHHARLWNKSLALQALEKAFAERGNMVWLNVEPEWEPIRADPRFQDLVRRVGLPVNTGGVVPH
jgi:hypothetical protein